MNVLDPQFVIPQVMHRIESNLPVTTRDIASMPTGYASVVTKGPMVVTLTVGDVSYIWHPAGQWLRADVVDEVALGAPVDLCDDPGCNEGAQ